MYCLLKNTFHFISKLWSGVYYRCEDTQESDDAQSFESYLAISSQTRAEEIGKCLVEVLEPTYF